ncbi:hypothetical protein [Dyadobacter sp. CY356]|uniref:hypothetical protein n=1 Tax=Dyadobacter sp. CY356 TaxID=2906442 RepID=UPI001F1E8F52|nr:hypothetical protein [Dyadobacter sp. CY356]MCF0057136.1 hypothetical protein [Dyadobacter sp. CY356]
MSNYLAELETEIIQRWPSTYNKLRKSHSDDIVTSLGVCIRNNPCWYIYAEYDGTIISIDLYVIQERANFNEVIWSLTSSAPVNIIGVRHIQKYWVKPQEQTLGFETIYYVPGKDPDDQSFLKLTIDQILDHILNQFRIR